MVSQLPKVSSVKPNFDYIKDVYEVCLKKYLENPKHISTALNSINNGRKILESDEEVDTYIAFYGAHHYYKLVEAFEDLDISQFCDNQLEIISYGCGAATDTCSLISYCRSKPIDLPFKDITLIDPSKIALKRGVEYINKALSPEENKKINIKKVNKTISTLKENDIYSEYENIKLHIFSNVLDIEEINLDDLTQLIKKNTQKGNNYFLCINPKNPESQRRIDDFHGKMSQLFRLLDISINEQSITDKRIWVMKNNGYVDNHPILRYHRIFKTDDL